MIDIIKSLLLIIIIIFAYESFIERSRMYYQYQRDYGISKTNTMSIENFVSVARDCEVYKDDTESNDRCSSIISIDDQRISNIRISSPLRSCISSPFF
jgi:hypothetical protein